MIAAWMLYTCLVSLLFGLAALAVERALRPHGIATRAAWAAAIGLSTLWPALLLLPSTHASVASVAPASVPVIGAVLEPLTVDVGAASWLTRLDTPLVLLWAVASGGLLCLAALSAWRLATLRGSWDAHGDGFLVSERHGPAVVGFLNPTVVLPSWFTSLDEDAQALVLEHEEQHRRAGDVRLLVLALLPALLLPWNAALWWQLRRLRVAVEGDCDLRVLRRFPHERRRYLDLLLRIASAPPGRLAAALAEPERSLDERIRIMTPERPRRPWTRGALLVALQALLLYAVWQAPRPAADSPEPVDDAGAAAVTLPPPGGIDVAPDDEQNPVFTPYTEAPEIVNRREVEAALVDAYPSELRAAGIGGSTHVWFFIGADGRVRDTRIETSSGHDALDRAALVVADAMRFSPAYNREDAVAVWVTLPITFQVR